jgi:hypothetical protein
MASTVDRTSVLAVHLVNAQKNGKMSPATLHYYEQQSRNSLSSVSTCAPSS